MMIFLGAIRSIGDAITMVSVSILFFLVITLLISFYQWRQSKTQMKELALDSDQGILIKLFSETFGNRWVGSSFPHRATLFIGDQFIFIRPRPWDWYSGQYRATIPIVFSKNPAAIKALTKINNIYAPDSIQPGNEGSIEIIFRFNPAIAAKTHFYIDFCHKADREKLEPCLFNSQP
jgi:hypothetical protein